MIQAVPAPASCGLALQRACTLLMLLHPSYGDSLGAPKETRTWGSWQERALPDGGRAGKVWGYPCCAKIGAYGRNRGMEGTIQGQRTTAQSVRLYCPAAFLESLPPAELGVNALGLHNPSASLRKCKSKKQTKSPSFICAFWF